MERENFRQEVEGKKRVTIVLKNGRNYSGIVYYLSQPNAQGDCIVYLQDRDNSLIKFQVSEVSVIEERGVKNGN
jgi:small nuclear ribonucleoprotein (snRNP)-like protein